MPDWLAITLALLSPVVSAGMTLFLAGRRFAVIETTQSQHSEALKALPETLRSFVSRVEGDGYQAQIKRLENKDAECEGKMIGIRQEFGDRFERAAQRVDNIEKSRSVESAATTGALAEIRAVMTAMKESIDRLAEAERERRRSQPAQPQTPDLIAQLQQYAQLQKFLSGFSREAA